MALISLKGKDSTPMHIGCISPSTPCISDDIIPYPMHIMCISPFTLCISGDIILYSLHIRIEVFRHGGVNMIPTPAFFDTLSLLNGGIFQGHFDEMSAFHTSRFVRLFPNESCGK